MIRFISRQLNNGTDTGYDELILSPYLDHQTGPKCPHYDRISMQYLDNLAIPLQYPQTDGISLISRQARVDCIIAIFRNQIVSSVNRLYLREDQ